jgi:hypothetical protein
MEEDREGVGGEEGGKGERGKWGRKGGAAVRVAARAVCCRPGIARAPADLAGATVLL